MTVWRSITKHLLRRIDYRTNGSHLNSIYWIFDSKLHFWRGMDRNIHRNLFSNNFILFQFVSTDKKRFLTRRMRSELWCRKSFSVEIVPREYVQRMAQSCQLVQFVSEIHRIRIFNLKLSKKKFVLRIISFGIAALAETICSSVQNGEVSEFSLLWWGWVYPFRNRMCFARIGKRSKWREWRGVKNIHLFDRILSRRLSSYDLFQISLISIIPYRTAENQKTDGIDHRKGRVATITTTDAKRNISVRW